MLNSFADELGDLVNLSIGAAAPSAAYALTQNPGVTATSASFVAATKGRKDSVIIRNESISGAVYGAFTHYSLAALKYLSNAAKVAYMVPWVFAANAFYLIQDHLVKNRTFTGLYNKFRETYIPNIRKAFKSAALMNIFSAIFVPQQYVVFAVAAATYVFRRFVAGGKIIDYDDKMPYTYAVSNVISKLFRNAGKGLYESAAAFGNTLSDLYKYNSKPPSVDAQPV